MPTATSRRHQTQPLEPHRQLPHPLVLGLGLTGIRVLAAATPAKPSRLRQAPADDLREYDSQALLTVLVAKR
jgi:hypothetical protein